MVPLFVEFFYKQIIAAAKGNDDKALLKKIATETLGGNLTTIICGAAPLDKKYIAGYCDFGITILEAYGITECSPAVSINRNHYHRAGSVGPVIPVCEVKIDDSDMYGHGEIYVKGGIVMLGYYNDEKATKDTFDGEWFKTGDIGYFDADGFLYIAGRKKNMILLSNGKNVYPEELEFALQNQIPYIKEVVVRSDDELIIAEVFLDKEKDPDCINRLEQDISLFNRTQALYKHIGRTIIRDTEFSKTTTRKIKRHGK